MIEVLQFLGACGIVAGVYWLARGALAWERLAEHLERRERSVRWVAEDELPPERRPAANPKA